MFPEELVVRGFETIQVILRKIQKSYPVGRKATPRMIREMQANRRRRNQGRILATIDCKADEAALIALAKEGNWPIKLFTAQDLERVSVRIFFRLYV